MERALPARLTAPASAVSDEQFWSLIGRLDWKRLGDDDAVVRPLVNALKALPVEEIYAFDDLLAWKLYALDTEAHARHMGEESYQGPEEHFSVDSFLYTRCCVVANGREVYQEILRDPAEFPEDAEFGALLYVASEAYEEKTGEKYAHDSPVSYETFSNRVGWGAVNGVDETGGP